MRTILHVDMDAFYASVEERDRPELRGKPVVVGGSPEGRGVVSAANYVARQFGLHSAMPALRARRLCPQAVFLPCRMDYYAQISRQIREIFQRYTPLVEPLSLDEAFLDVTGSAALFGTGPQIAQQIKQQIQSELQLVASVGVASSKFLAKIASDLQKPDALVVVDPHGVQEFLDPLSIERVWGIGRRGLAVFHRLGVRTIGQLRGLPAEVLERKFGKHGRHLWNLAHGRDERQVVPDHQAKSISHETTFAQDVGEPEVLEAWLLELVEQVARRLRRHQLRAGAVHLKVRASDFSTITRSQTLAEPSNITDELWQTAAQLLRTRLPEGFLPVRLLGMGVGSIDATGLAQRSLFDQERRERQSQLDAAADEIRSRFGASALRRGSSLEHDVRHRPEPKREDL